MRRHICRVILMYVSESEQNQKKLNINALPLTPMIESVNSHSTAIGWRLAEKNYQHNFSGQCVLGMYRIANMPDNWIPNIRPDTK